MNGVLLGLGMLSGAAALFTLQGLLEESYSHDPILDKVGKATAFSGFVTLALWLGYMGMPR